MKSRSKLMLDKSIAAMISAIEIYNKPDFKYREELFSVLCINAWELLLKAKILNLASNNTAALYIFEYKILKNGTRSKKKYRKTNRSNNPLSISLFRAYQIITEDYGVKIDNAVLDNLKTLTEIRDNSIHFVNSDIRIATKIQELGTASLQNYFHIVTNWFGSILTGYNFYLMPLSFLREFDFAHMISLNKNEQNILDFIHNKENEYGNTEPGKYNLTLKIDVKFERVKSNKGMPVQITNDPNAPKVVISEEDFTEKFPWDFGILSTRLKKRYSDFKMNDKYHKIRKQLAKNNKLAHIRYMNPNNPNSTQQCFYSPNIQKEFDKYYSKI